MNLWKYGRVLPVTHCIFVTICLPTLRSVHYCNTLCSYPSQRSVKDHDGHMKGVMGTVTELQVCQGFSVLYFKTHHARDHLLQSKTFTTQPVASFDWSPDKEAQTPNFSTQFL